MSLVIEAEVGMGRGGGSRGCGDRVEVTCKCNGYDLALFYVFIAERGRNNDLYILLRETCF